MFFNSEKLMVLKDYGARYNCETMEWILLSQVLMLLKAYKIMEIGKYESIFEIVGFKIWI